LIAVFLCVETVLVQFYFRDWIITSFLTIGAIWFLADATLLWKDRAYSPKQMRLFLWGWNAGCRAGNVLELGTRYAYSLRLRRRISTLEPEMFARNQCRESGRRRWPQRAAARTALNYAASCQLAAITPSIALMHAVREHLSIPVFAMIRPPRGRLCLFGR